MDVYRGSHTLPRDFATAVAIGTFDGVHRGHRSLLDALIALARDHQLKATVLSFDPPPVRLIAPDRAPPLIMTEQQKLRALELAGLDATVIDHFDTDYAALSADEFIETVLVGRLRARHVFVGCDFRFGVARSGDTETLEKGGLRHGFEVHPADLLISDGEPITSTRVRKALLAGQVGQAAEWLGRPFALIGQVAAGAGRGRQIGFPTANLDTEGELLPGLGVYAAWVNDLGSGVLDGPYKAAVNIGKAPTFERQRVVVEAHLVGFSGNLLDARLEVNFVARLREEMKFDGVAALKAQLSRDVARATAILDSSQAY